MDMPVIPLGDDAGVQSFADVLRRGLTPRRWERLAGDISVRFTPGERPGQRFVGTMHWVYCSPIGAVIGRLLRPFSILPDCCARDCGFEFSIRPGHGVLHKQRRYRLGAGHEFVFDSRFGAAPTLHEEFAGGIGMRLALFERRGALLFRDRGYFLRLGRRRLSLPRWLTVGRFELLHRNIDRSRFQIIIRVAHPLFGTLFYQRGEFRTGQERTCPRS